MKRSIVAALALLVILLAGGCPNLVTGTDTETEDGIGVGVEHRGDEIVLRLGTGTDAETVATALGAVVSDSAMIGDRRYVQLRLPEGTDATEAVERAENLPGILLAYPEARWHVFLEPDDSLYAGHQYAPQIANLETAWDTTLGDDVVIAVVDSGINTQHEDLGGSTRFVAGWDAINEVEYGVSENLDDNGHGTHVAGIAGAIGDNAQGIAGVAWNSVLMPVKVMDADGSGTSIDIAEGIEFVTNAAIADPSRRYVLNLSLGGISTFPAAVDAITRAVENGVVVVAAMGNDGMDIVKYPAAYPGVIAVGSTNGRDELSDFSSFGRHVDLVAPGEDIWSLTADQDDGYVSFNGTSMASPFVAGVAALLLSEDPTLTPAEVQEALVATADDRGEAGWDDEYGAGRVNAAAALAHTTTGSYGAIDVTVTNGGTPIEGAEVLLLTGDGTTVLHATVTGSDGTVLLPMLATDTAYDIVASYYGETFTADDVTPAETPTPVSAAFDLTPTITIATHPVQYDGNAIYVDSRLSIYDDAMNLIQRVSYRNDPPTVVSDLYPIATVAVSTPTTLYAVVDVNEPLASYEQGYVTIYANEGSATTGGGLAVAAGGMPPDPGDDFGSATPVGLDTYYPFVLLSDDVAYFELTLD